MSHPQEIPRRQPLQGRSSRGSWTPGGTVAPRGRRFSGRGGSDEQDPLLLSRLPLPPRGPHRVKGGEHEVGNGPLEKELLWCGEGQAKVESKLGGRGRQGTQTSDKVGTQLQASRGKEPHQTVCTREVFLLSARGPVGWSSSCIWDRSSMSTSGPAEGIHTLPIPGSLPPTNMLSLMETGTPSLP